MTDEQPENSTERQAREIQDSIKTHRETIRILEKKLRELVGPFEVGQMVRVPAGGAKAQVKVVAIDRAFGDWVVKVKFDELGRDYIYPASVVEVDE